MAMSHRGLVKLSEECAEAIQIAQKLVAYPELQLDESLFALHPDGQNLRQRLQEEIADVIAAIEFVESKLGLTRDSLRVEQKIIRFHRWDSER